ncbi:unnamed protein product [Didymodactylos carnosus]|uniref:Uncharacterized protein n=1 Tax=Didymodactylos carnosus TaxID=1234261 RepID=A0A8S2DLK5_9BILA|nr:unnamed protein product [Didymodactylos carnosus]CAF3699275.1 unnamed protein product [Didymodactylos carnosus]
MRKQKNDIYLNKHVDGTCITANIQKTHEDIKREIMQYKSKSESHNYEKDISRLRDLIQKKSAVSSSLEIRSLVKATYVIRQEIQSKQRCYSLEMKTLSYPELLDENAVSIERSEFIQSKTLSEGDQYY